MQRETIFVLLAMVALASANFWCCPGERRGENKEVKKAPGAAAPASDFSAYSPTGSRAIFAKPVSSNAIPTVNPIGETANLATRHEKTPIETSDSYRGPSEYMPKASVPMSPPRINAINRSPIRDTENIPTPTPGSVPIETRSRSPMPTTPMRSRISNPQENERNEKPNGISAGSNIPMPPAPPKLPNFSKNSTPTIKSNGPTMSNAVAKDSSMPSYQGSSTGLNNNGLSKGSNIPMPPTPPKLPNFSKTSTSPIKKSGPTMSNPTAKDPSLSSYQGPSTGLNNNNGLSGDSNISMPPAPPKLPNFSKSSTSTFKKNGSTMSNPVAKASTAAPSMPSYQGSSMGLSKATLAAVRTGLKPIQNSNSNPKPTQLYGKPDTTESKWPSNPINSMRQTNQRSFKPSHKTPESEQTSQDTNNERASVTNLARRFDNPVSKPVSSNPMLSEFAVISQRRNRINNVNWDQFDKNARKL